MKKYATEIEINSLKERLSYTNWIAANYFLAGKTEEIDSFIEFRGLIEKLLAMQIEKKIFDDTQKGLDYFDGIFTSESGEDLYAINSSNSTINENITIDDKTFSIQLEPRSKCKLKQIEDGFGDLEWTQNTMENACIKLFFNEEGTLLNILDKRNNTTYASNIFELTVFDGKSILTQKSKAKQLKFEKVESRVLGNLLFRINTYLFGETKLFEFWRIEQNSSTITYNYKCFSKIKNIVSWLRMSIPDIAITATERNFLNKPTSGVESINAQSTTLNNPMANIFDFSTKEGGIALLTTFKGDFAEKAARIMLQDEYNDLNDVECLLHVHQGAFKDSDTLFVAERQCKKLRVGSFAISINNFVEIDNDAVWVDYIRLSDDKKELNISFKENFGEKVTANIKVGFRSLGAFVMNKESERIKINSMPIDFAPYETLEISFVL